MNDKIAKLPKWAREHIEHIERKSALHWPDFPKPAPCFTADHSAWQLVPKEFHEKRIWSMNKYYTRNFETYNNSAMFLHTWLVSPSGHVALVNNDTGKAGTAQRPTGDYYASEEYALGALIHEIAFAAASRLSLAYNLRRTLLGD